MSDAAQRRPGLVTFGETMGLVTAVEPGPLELARHITYGIGGAESNVAIGAARLGSTVTWFGRVGRDATGDLIERRLRAELAEAIVIRDDSFTGLMVKHRRFANRLHVDYHRAGSAGSHLTPDDVPTAVLEAAGILHVTGITPALSDTARETVLHAVRTARAAGVTVCLDVNYRSKLWEPDAARPVLRELVTLADIVFAGPAEGALVLGLGHEQRAERLAAALSDLGPAEVIIKDGARGCTATIDTIAHVVPALDVPLVDPVGAGDAFVAGYLAERLDGQDARVRLQTAVTAGALAVTVAGDCEGLPTRADVRAAVCDQDVTR